MEKQEIEFEDFKDTLVKHRTALKAREKGFYCITPHRFLNEKQIVGGWISGNTPEPSKEQIEIYLSNPEELLIAPTAGVLHQWLKIIHNISVHTEPVYSGVPKIGAIFQAYLFFEKTKRVDFTNAYADEAEAFEAGIYEALHRLH